MGTGGAGSEPGPVAGQARGDYGYRARPYARRRHDAIAFAATRHCAWPAPPSTWWIYSPLVSRLPTIC